MDNLENQEKAEALFIKAGPYISERSPQDYEKVLELNPGHLPALWNLGCLYDGDHDYSGHGSYWDELYLANNEKAIDCFRRIIEIDPKYNQGKAYYRLARNSAGSNREKALEYYLQYLNVNPEDYSAIGQLGDIYYFLNRKQEATANYIKCIQHDQKDYRALQGLAKIYEEQGNFNGALQCLKKCTEIYVKCGELHAHIGRIYDKMGNTKEAMNSYRKCNHLSSNNKQARAYIKRLLH